MSVHAASTFQSFAKIVLSYQQQYGDPGPSTHRLDSPLRPEVIFDDEGGLISSFMAAIEQSIRAGISSASWDTDDSRMTDEERACLLQEHRSWQCIRAVLENQICQGALAPVSASAELASNPYISPEDLIQAIVNEDPELSLFATLIEHLQSRALANGPPPLEYRHGYIPTTIRRAKAARLQSAPLTPPSYDPDFTLRDPHGSGLAGEDQTYQAPLLEKLWDLVRHGELDQAVKVCEEGGEPWRGATLMGGRRWNMGGMTPNSEMSALEGNRTRILWKKACKAMAKNPTLSPAERHLYAALTSDLPTLLPACVSWEDQLWAHVLSRMEAKLEQKWAELGGFWRDEEQLLGKDDADEEVGTLDDVFAAIAHSGSDEAKMSNDDPYITAQRYIIQGRSQALVNHVANHLHRLPDMASSQSIGAFVRFFAHLVLVLRSLNMPIDDSAANNIIQGYLSVLEEEGEDDLVAMYAACLREGTGEQSYARFLRTMDPGASKETRAEALKRAKENDLDVAAIAVETVRMTLEDIFATIPALSGDQPDILSFSTGLTERDVELIRSIEWLTMVPETAKGALVESNAVARYFLALGHAGACQALLNSLPLSVALVEGDDGNHIVEHEHYQALFAAFACHEAIEEIIAKSPNHTATKLEQHSWRKTLLAAIEKTESKTIELLTGDWLRFPLDTSANAAARRAELARIRQIFIPDLVFRLHLAFISHRQHSPPLLQKALDLAKVVAEEENHAYEEFFGRDSHPGRLTAYLDNVREASILSLKSGGSPFEVITN